MQSKSVWKPTPKNELKSEDASKQKKVAKDDSRFKSAEKAKEKKKDCAIF